MFQLTKGELEILRSQFVISKKTDYQDDDNWKSQNATSNLSDNLHDSVLISQNATSKPVERRGGTQKRPSGFTEQGVAMLSSVLQSEAEFCGNWRDSVHFNYQEIEEEKGMPSPNRPRKRKNFLKIIMSYLNNMRKKL